MHLKTFCVFLVVSCLPTAAYAVPTITAGNWIVLPGVAGQSVDLITALPIAILVSGGDPIQGVDLFMTSGPDGFTPFSGHRIQAIDLIGPGTIFHGNNTGQFDHVPLPSLNTWSSTTTAAGTVAASGTLAFLTIDATGVAPGIYQLQLTNLVIGAPSDLPPFSSPVLIDGAFTIIPEPGSIVLGLFATAGLCVVALGHRRKLTKLSLPSGAA